MRFAIILFLVMLAATVAAQEPSGPLLDLGPLNGAAKMLPAPRIANASRLRIEGEIKVRVHVDLQKGEVLDAEIGSGGHPMVNAAVLKAAKGAKFVPALLQFPPVYGGGFLTYKIADFNKMARVNKKPRPLLIATKDKLNPKALVPFPKPKVIRSGKNFVAGTVEVAVLIDSMIGKVLTAKAVSGPKELRTDSEKTAMKVKFAGSMISSAKPLYVTGIIVYRFDKSGRVD